MSFSTLDVQVIDFLKSIYPSLTIAEGGSHDVGAADGRWRLRKSTFGSGMSVPFVAGLVGLLWWFACLLPCGSI